jgi:hypothetical protein
MIYITTQHEQGVKNRYESDGAIGHHFLNWLKGPILSQRYDLRYLHNNIVPDYMGTQWNEFLGLNKKVPSKLNVLGVPVYSVNDIKDCQIIDIPQIEWDARYDHPTIVQYIKKYEYSSITEDENILLRTAPGRGMQIDWQYFLNNDLREKYDFARQANPVGLYNPDDFYIACIHWRKGDINPKDQPERWITNEQYYKLINNIKDVLDNLCIRYKIQIISEGEQKDFGCATSIDNVEFILNESPMISFHRMVTSDILVNAKSAFSVCAAYLHRGPKLCIPFSIYWQQTHPDNDNFKDLIWINDNMDFDSEKISESLRDNNE